MTAGEKFEILCYFWPQKQLAGAVCQSSASVRETEGNGTGSRSAAELKDSAAKTRFYF